MLDRALIDGVSLDNHHRICYMLKLGAMNNWCKFGKDAGHIQGKRIWPPGGHKYN